MTDPAPITRRAWTARMADSLGLPRRRIQKLLVEGAPDIADDQLTDWPAWETRWRTWIAHSPRWRGMTRRLRAPANLDHQHTAPAPPTTTIPEDELATLGILEREKVLKARADRTCAELDLGAKLGRLIERKAAHDALVGGMQIVTAMLADAPAHIAAECDPTIRDVVRGAATRVIEGERHDLLRRVRQFWRSTVPVLTLTPGGER